MTTPAPAVQRRRPARAGIAVGWIGFGFVSTFAYPFLARTLDDVRVGLYVAVALTLATTYLAGRRAIPYAVAYWFGIAVAVGAVAIYFAWLMSHWTDF
jgi:hypothetical protein